MLAIKNAHERDKDITFDEGPHIYTVRGEQGYTSVTTWNHEHFSKFDSAKILGNIMRSPKMKDPSYKYYGMTAEEILKSWDDNRDAASSAGTQTHYNIECFYNGMDMKDESIEFKYFKEFVRDHPHLEAYRTEWCVFYEEIKVSGSIDMVFRDKNTGEYLIYDWKRSKEIKTSNTFQSGLGPMSHLPDCNYWHYSLQLNVYRWILESYYGLDVADMYLVIMHPDAKGYKRMRLNRMDAEVAAMVECRKRAVAAGNSRAIPVRFEGAAAHEQSDSDEEPVGDTLQIVM